MASIASTFFGKMSRGPRSKQPADSSGISAPSAGSAGRGGPSGGPWIEFSVTAKGMQADETLYMVGDDDDLGAWNPLLGKRLSCKDGKTWTIRRPLKRGMSMTYKFVSVSKGIENGDTYVRWENQDKRALKTPSFTTGPLTNRFEFLEIRGFGDRQHVAPPEIQASQLEMEDSALRPEPEPRGICQEKETTSAFEGTGAQEWLCQDGSRDSALREGQEQRDEMVNTFVSLKSKVDDVIDSKPPQAESVDVELRAQEWLRDCVPPSRTQHVSEDQFTGLCPKVAVAEAFLPTESSCARKFEAVETDAGLQEKLLERMAKLETDAAVQAESVAKLQAKIEGLVHTEGNRYLKDGLSQKQQELEHAVNCVEKMIKHIPTKISDFETRFEQVESVLDFHKNDLDTLISDYHTWSATLSSDSKKWFREVENAHKNDIVALVSHFDIKFKEVESALASQKADLATLTSGTRSTLDKVESAVAAQKKDLAAIVSDSGAEFEKVEIALASQKKTLSGLQRQINDLDLKIPEPDDSPQPPSLDSAAQKEIQQTQQKLKDLEGQVASLSETVQKMFENSTSAAKLKLSSSIAAPPLHPTKLGLQSDRAPHTVVQNADLDEWNDLGLQPGDLEAKGMNVKQPQSNTRACCKDDLKTTGKSAFSGFPVPPKPEDEAIAKVCLEVEEKLHAAVRQNDPLDARKSLLRKVLLRLHSDKTGETSAGMIWMEDWKNTHIKWYYHPHPVPEDQQKYMPK